MFFRASIWDTRGNGLLGLPGEALEMPLTVRIQASHPEIDAGFITISWLCHCQSCSFLTGNVPDSVRDQIIR